jgi:uncharacterized protein
LSQGLLAVIGDVHAHHKRLEQVCQHIEGKLADGVLLVGDLGSNDLAISRERTRGGDFLYLKSVEAVLERVARLGVPYAYVPGNHDLPDLSLPGNVDRRVVDVAGFKVGGIGGAGPDQFGFAYEWEEWEVRQRKALDCDVLLSHCPPRRTALDRMHDGRHVGSEAIAERARAHKGVLVCGHIHEAPGVLRIGDCLAMNVGGLGVPFGRAQVGYVRGLDRVEHHDLLSGKVTALDR